MKVGDKVRFTSSEMHEIAPDFYPEPGTVGVIRQTEKRGGFWVQWPIGTTSQDDFFHAATCNLELAE